MYIFTYIYIYTSTFKGVPNGIPKIEILKGCLIDTL